ncbi:MAG: cytochrome C oxidase subunit IV family protein [Acidimicrobiia bacterium]|nr:cytochrome C oxidase subunit IV family protein [Acidimicrobiia bacterium]
MADTTTATEPADDMGVELEPAPSDLPVPVTPDEDIGEVRGYATPIQYVQVAVILCVLTALEVWMYYLEGDVPNGVVTALLLLFAFLKFFLVVSFYMHLREDKPIFRRLFVLGLVAALVLYAIVLATFQLIF